MNNAYLANWIKILYNVVGGRLIMDVIFVTLELSVEDLDKYYASMLMASKACTIVYPGLLDILPMSGKSVSLYQAVIPCGQGDKDRTSKYKTSS